MWLLFSSSTTQSSRRGALCLVVLLGLAGAPPSAAAEEWRSYFTIYDVPDLQKWGSVKEGTSLKEVEKVLGAPKSRTTSMGDNSVTLLEYGAIEFRSPQCPGRRPFLLLMIENTVVEKSGPFEDTTSSATSPGVPVLLVPDNNWKVKYSPPVADLRWGLVAGDGVKYEVEVDVGAGEVWIENSRIATVIPYCTIRLKGMNDARWRVRAVCNSSTGKWSDYRYFSFRK